MNKGRFILGSFVIIFILSIILIPVPLAVSVDRQQMSSDTVKVRMEGSNRMSTAAIVGISAAVAVYGGHFQ
jgi:hypothetical protein